MTFFMILGSAWAWLFKLTCKHCRFCMRHQQTSPSCVCMGPDFPAYKSGCPPASRRIAMTKEALPESSRHMDCCLQTPSPPAAQRPASRLRTSHGPATPPLFGPPKFSTPKSAPADAPSARRWQPPSSPATSALWAVGPILGSKENPYPRGPKVRPHRVQHAKFLCEKVCYQGVLLHACLILPAGQGRQSAYSWDVE